jgi:integrase
MKLAELVEHWIAARNPAPKTAASTRRVARYFVSLLGDLGIGEIGHVQMFDFRDALALMPRNLTRLERTCSFRYLAARFADGNDPRPKVAPTTVGKQLNMIQSLFGYAYSERWIIDDDVHNIPVNGHNPFQRRPFSKDEVTQLFSTSLFIRPWASTPERRHIVSNETVRWLMFLGLLTGARLEELGQLHVADVQSQQGIFYIEISETVYGGRAEKSIKSPSSKRQVPIHPRLIDLGFLRFARQRRLEGKLRLFPELERNSYDRYTGDASRRCNRVIDRVSKDPALVFHSFRHLFKDLCRTAGILECINDQLTGHLPMTVGARYGRGASLAALDEAVRSVDVEFVAWEPILRAV